MISLSELAAGLEGASLVGRHQLTCRCPRCGGQAEIRDFGARRSYRCETCGKLEESDFQGSEVPKTSTAPNGPPPPTSATPRTRAPSGKSPLVSSSICGRDEAARTAPDSAADAGSDLHATETGCSASDSENPILHASAARNDGRGPSVDAWKANLYDLTKGGVENQIQQAGGGASFRAFFAGADIELWLQEIGKHRNRANSRLSRDPRDLTEIERDEELQVVARRLQLDYALPVVQNGHQNGVVPAKSLIIWEEHDQAVIANEAYLKRQPVVESLLYSSAISLIVGGKHHGKSTILRSLALSIAKGLPFLGRQTRQGHVIYAASDDEVMTARMELLRMGWDQREDPLALVHIDPESTAEPRAVLDAIGEKAVRHKTVFIATDMLFDFAGIKDEMSYAGTRQAVGLIQTLASQTESHVQASHHSPKHLPDIATAAVAALGSQGIAARFSPIILARKWADKLFTIESTMARDPRGVAINPTVVNITAEGRAESKGDFKNWMKWVVYAPRVMALIESDEPYKEFSVTEVMKALEIGRPEAQNALKNLYENGQLYRARKGKGFRYWLPVEGAPKPSFGGESQN